MTSTATLGDSFDEEPDEGLAESMALLRKAQQGDDQAMNDLLVRYQSRVLRIVRIRLGPKLRARIEAEDIAQETFLIATRLLKDFKPEDHSSFIRWLAKIVENKIRDAHDHWGAQKRSPDREASVSFHLAADQTSPSGRAFKNEIREIMDEAMTRLPEDYREVILLKDYSEASWEEIAKVLKRGKHACQQLYQRANIRLRRIVAEGLPSE